MAETIIALATPTGRSGIGVIRLSGSKSLKIFRMLAQDYGFAPDPRVVYLKQLYSTPVEVIDEALVTYFQAPHSFTGEDVIEISGHGSPVLLRQVIDICLASGARMAEAGEFTLRALSNGRMDLAEAEAVRDLIDAQTTGSARQAVRQLRGEFSIQLQPLKDDLLNVIVLLESALEFVEDDLPENQLESVRNRLVAVAETTETIASTFKAGRLIREGLKVALIGRPNVGKSSLFNALLGIERAIVTEIPGTTRDQLHERYSLDGIPISLIDTAGIRETLDIVESIGVERSRAVMADADVVVVMVDAAEPLTGEDHEIFESVGGIEHLVVLNKIDKIAEPEVEFIRGTLESDGRRVIAISAMTGSGLTELQCAIVEPFSTHETSDSGFLVTDARHHDLLQRAASEIRESLARSDEKMSEEIILIGLQNALRYLGQITGETTTEDMLSRIFETFCIGK
ncbi:MAG: tRNA uridine-5-carboxymethylaminomethyl(34) synthesis GTPase MnmE [Acidobacteriota bacterium]